RSLNGGYTCVQAPSLADALTALNDHIFDLIIADLGLPDVAQGQQHLGVESLRRAAPGLPLVVVTGDELGASICGALVRAGASTIATKGTGHAYAAHLAVQVTAAIEQERYIRRRLDQASQAARATAEAALAQSLDTLTTEIRAALAERPALAEDDPTVSTEPTDPGVEMGRETGGMLVKLARLLGPGGRRFAAGLLASGLGTGWWWLPALVESCTPTPPSITEPIEGTP
ncbi:MAG: CheY-like chemotaxis protein, partial [Myxococcota bacterium]